MRLEMRRLAGPAAVAALLVVSASGCTPHAPIGDVVSGAPKGSALVKVLVTLTDDSGGNCTAQVEPARVIVFRGSAIRLAGRQQVHEAARELPAVHEAHALPLERQGPRRADALGLPFLHGPDRDPRHRQGTQRPLLRGSRDRRPGASTSTASRARRRRTPTSRCARAAAASRAAVHQRGGLSEGLRRSRRPRRLARVIASSPKRFVTSSRTLSSGEGALGSSKRASWGFASPKWEA